MNQSRHLTPTAILAVLTLALHAPSARACAACYGQSDSPLAAGMNWGIMTLLGMIVLVLGGVAAFFVFLARRSAALAAPAAAVGQSSSSARPKADVRAELELCAPSSSL